MKPTTIDHRAGERPFEHLIRMAESPEPPPFVAKDRLARAEWARCEPPLRQRGMFDGPLADVLSRRVTLGEYCRAWANLQRHRKIIAYQRRYGAPVTRWQRQDGRNMLAFAIRQVEDLGLEWDADGRAIVPPLLTDISGQSEE